MGESYVNVTEGSGKKLHSWQRTIGANNVEDEVVLHGEPYLATYTAVMTGSAATSTSHWQLMAGSSLNVYVRRIRVFQITVATTAALVPWSIQRLATAGTGGTAVTTTPMDTTDGASGATAMSLPTAKGTESGTAPGLIYGYMVQTLTASMQPGMALVAEWDFDLLRGKALRIPAGTANGIAVSNRAAVAGASVAVEVTFSEASF